MKAIRIFNTTIICWLLLILCSLVLLGWQFDVPVLRRVIANAPETTPLTALMLLLLSVGLALSKKATTEPTGAKWGWCVWLATGIAMAGGLWTAIQYVCDLQPGIEAALYTDRLTLQRHLSTNLRNKQ